MLIPHTLERVQRAIQSGGGLRDGCREGRAFIGRSRGRRCRGGGSGALAMITEVKVRDDRRRESTTFMGQTNTLCTRPQRFTSLEGGLMGDTETCPQPATPEGTGFYLFVLFDVGMNFRSFRPRRTVRGCLTRIGRKDYGVFTLPGLRRRRRRESAIVFLRDKIMTHLIISFNS